jgi:Ulp1 family protease
MQDNGCDCGVFVCRYALGMFKLRHFEFTNDEAGFRKGSDSNHTCNRRHITRRNLPLSNLITNGGEFNFDCGDIHRIRIEYQTLIKNLYPLYGQFYKKKEAMEKEETKARKESRQRIAKARKNWLPEKK